MSGSTAAHKLLSRDRRLLNRVGGLSRSRYVQPNRSIDDLIRPEAGEADRRTLIRRATFDLTGLPPTPKEVDDFLVDKTSNAYEKLIDRLLASPRLWRAMGAHVARCRAICRHGGL